MNDSTGPHLLGDCNMWVVKGDGSWLIRPLHRTDGPAIVSIERNLYEKVCWYILDIQYTDVYEWAEAALQHEECKKPSADEIEQRVQLGLANAYVVD